MSGILLTESASNKVKYFIDRKENAADVFLRVNVQPGGCSGLRYEFLFDRAVKEGDSVKEFGEIRVVVDKMSSPYLDGATIDFIDTIQKQGFTIDNPNAGGSCACGDSFS